MKTLKINNYRILLLFLPFFLVGCEKGLDPVFDSTLITDDFPKTKDDFQNLVFSTYVHLEAKWSYANGNDWAGYTFHCSEQYGILFYNDMPSDLVAVYNNGWGGDWWNGSNGDFSYTISNENTQSHFSKVKYISRITQIVDLVSKASSDILNDSVRRSMLAEARLSRGWIMWYLLYYFGPVPVIMDPQLLSTKAEWDLTRPSREDYIKWVEADLQYAAANLPQSWSDPYYGRYTKGLANTLLMRLYMNEHRWADAVTVGNTIKSLGYSLVSDYSSMFVPSGERNSEMIYAISASEKSTGGEDDYNFNPIHYYIYPSWYTSEGIKGWSSPSAVYMAHWNFYDSFDPSDKRRLMLNSYTETSGTVHNRSNMNGAIVLKFKVETSGTTYRGNDIPIARYADVLLMLAEALNETTSVPSVEAIGYVNQVRHRAGLNDLANTDIASQNAFRDAILRERGWELYFEGLRRYDLVRMGKWKTALASAGKVMGPSSLLPIPQFAIDAGKGTLKQNEDYH
jgi:starch-binding outer membrane protein, SusD/RagB family